MNTIKIALAAALFAVTSSVAFAAPHKHVAHQHSAPVLQQREVALPTEPTQGNSAGPFYYNWSGPTTGGM